MLLGGCFLEFAVTVIGFGYCSSPMPADASITAEMFVGMGGILCSLIIGIIGITIILPKIKKINLKFFFLIFFSFFVLSSFWYVFRGTLYSMGDPFNTLNLINHNFLVKWSFLIIGLIGFSLSVLYFVFNLMNLGNHYFDLKSYKNKFWYLFLAIGIPSLLAIIFFEFKGLLKIWMILLSFGVVFLFSIKKVPEVQEKQTSRFSLALTYSIGTVMLFLICFFWLSEGIDLWKMRYSTDDLIYILRHDKDSTRRLCVTFVFQGTQDKKPVPALIEALKNDTYKDVRGSAANALGDIKDKKAVPALIEALKNDASANVRGLVAHNLGEIKDKQAVPALIEALKNDRDEFVRKFAASALGEIKDERSVPALIDVLRDINAKLRKISNRSLKKITNQDFNLKYDDPEKEREKAIEKWQEWWEENKDSYIIPK